MQHFNYDLKVIVVIAAIRKLRNYTQLYLASELGIDRSTYSRLERGEAIMSPGRVDKIAKILDSNVNTILVLATSFDSISFEEKNIEEIVRLFLVLYAPRIENLTYSVSDLNFIFSTIKRYYPKVIAKDIS